MATITWKIYSAHLLLGDGTTMDDVKRYESALREALTAEYPDHEVRVVRVDKTSGVGAGLSITDDEDLSAMELRALEDGATDLANRLCERALVRPDAPTVHCECGEAMGEACEWTGPVAETVVVEWMPEYLRASHAAAGNAGSHPANGAMRLRVERSCAERLREGDEEWCHIV